jgi:hypothetical protein
MSAQHIELSHRDYLGMTDGARNDNRQTDERIPPRSNEFELERNQKA